MGIDRLIRALFGRDRQGHRVDGAAATVHIDGAPHPVIDWSESGMRLDTFDDAPPVGERFAFRFELPLTSEDVFEFEAWAEVIECGGRGIAARFLFVEDDLLARLRAVVRVLDTTDISEPSGPIDYG